MEEYFEVPDHLDEAITHVRALWNDLGGGDVSPFNNIAVNFSCEVFSLQSYLWTVEDPPPNFVWGDLEVSWYKYCGRSMTANREVSQAESARLRDECSDALRTIAAGRRAIINENSTVLWI